MEENGLELSLEIDKDDRFLELGDYFLFGPRLTIGIFADRNTGKISEMRTWIEYDRNVWGEKRPIITVSEKGAYIYTADYRFRGYTPGALYRFDLAGPDWRKYLGECAISFKYRTTEDNYKETSCIIVMCQEERRGSNYTLSRIYCVVNENNGLFGIHWNGYGELDSNFSSIRTEDILGYAYNEDNPFVEMLNCDRFANADIDSDSFYIAYCEGEELQKKLDEFLATLGN